MVNRSDLRVDDKTLVKRFRRCEAVKGCHSARKGFLRVTWGQSAR